MTRIVNTARSITRVSSLGFIFWISTACCVSNRCDEWHHSKIFKKKTSGFATWQFLTRADFTFRHGEELGNQKSCSRFWTTKTHGKCEKTSFQYHIWKFTRKDLNSLVNMSLKTNLKHIRCMVPAYTECYLNPNASNTNATLHMEFPWIVFSTNSMRKSLCVEILWMYYARENISFCTSFVFVPLKHWLNADAQEKSNISAWQHLYRHCNSDCFHWIVNSVDTRVSIKNIIEI